MKSPSFQQGCRRVIVARGGALGDFLLTLPVFDALTHQFPKAERILLGKPDYAAVALQEDFFHRVIALDSMALARFFSPDLATELPEEIAKVLKETDLIISFLFDPEGAFIRNVQRCSSALFLQGPHRPDEKQNIHAADVFLQPIERLGIPVPNRAPSLPHLHRRGGSDIIAVHPGSGSPHKNWPLPRWKELAKRLLATGNLQLLLIAGEAEEGILAELCSELHTDRIIVLENASLATVAGALARSRFYVGHDSGISHLAACVGVPSLLLWGPSNQMIWAPRNRSVTIISGPTGLASLTVDHVYEDVVLHARL